MNLVWLFVLFNLYLYLFFYYSVFYCFNSFYLFGYAVYCIIGMLCWVGYFSVRGYFSCDIIGMGSSMYNLVLIIGMLLFYLVLYVWVCRYMLCMYSISTVQYHLWLYIFFENKNFFFFLTSFPFGIISAKWSGRMSQSLYWFSVKIVLISITQRRHLLRVLNRFFLFVPF